MMLIKILPRKIMRILDAFLVKKKENDYDILTPKSQIT